jgi:feruloyl esterase
MRRHRLAGFCALLIALWSVQAPRAVTVATCEDLATSTLDHASITLARPVPAGFFTPPEGTAVNVAVPFCRIALTLKPSAGSSIASEVWLPLNGWNGKFQGVGNGGFAGTISYGPLAAAVTRGYAAASTDTGHKASSGIDASWALNQPEKIRDFGYRAIHETAVAGKALTAAFYSAAPRRAYFSSCSNGGRQALMEAQRFPDDYDGIIAGAPANYWTRLLSMAAADVKAMLAQADSYFPESKLPAISAAALAACDANDQVKDGVIENPAACRFDPSVLLCKGQENDSCLTTRQLTALKEIYAPKRTSTGQPIMPGFSPGGEAERGGWSDWVTGTAPKESSGFGFATQFFSYMVFNDPAWDFRTFNLDRDWKIAEERVGSDLDADSTDLRAFRARGGKLILYQGWSDAAIPAQHTIDYYNAVVAAMGPSAAANVIRLFMVPGMQHCSGGNGATAFGQLAAATGDPDRSISAALERWVDQNIAPQRLIASKTNGSTVVRTHPLCAYPQTAQYVGTGSPDDAANFVCR